MLERTGATTSVHFSCLAECACDVERWKQALPIELRLVAKVTTLPAGGRGTPVDIELGKPVCDSDLRAAMRMVPDSHVMLQTLRPVPVSRNSLERDWNTT